MALPSSRPVRTAGTLVLVGALVSGCSSGQVAEFEKQVGDVLPTFLGTAGGYFACQALGGEGAQCIAAALAGGYVGNRIGAYLNERDQQSLALAMAESQESRENRTWESEDGSYRGEITYTGQEVQQEEQEIEVLRDQVEVMPPVEIKGGVYQATSTLNVRSGPSTDYRVVRQLSEGEATKVIGKVRGEPWLVLQESGAAVTGFVSSDFMEPASETATSQLAEELEGQPAQTGTGAERVTVNVSRSCVKQNIVIFDSGSDEPREVKENETFCPTADGDYEPVA